MKKGVLIVSVLALFVLMLLIADIGNPKLSGFAIYNPTLSNNCSAPNIKAVWDSIFQESSDGITIVNNESYNATVLQDGIQTTKCLSYVAYKIKNNEELYLLYSSLAQFLGNMEITFAVKANVTSDYIQRIQSIKTSNLAVGDLRDDSGSLLESQEIYTDVSSIPVAKLKVDNTQTAQNNISTLGSAFKLNLGDWLPNNYSTADSSWIIYTINQSGVSLVEGVVTSLNYTQRQFEIIRIVQEASPSQCTASWRAMETPCQSNGNYTVWFKDMNFCNVSYPSAITNKSYLCGAPAAEGRNVIGSPRENYTDVTVYVDSEIPADSNLYNSTRKIDLKEGTINRIEFYYNFSADLNLSAITITQQPTNYSFGYMIINGLPLTKKITIDRLNPASKQICVKNAAISDISEISASCNGTDEVLVNCTGVNGAISCIKDTDTFVVSGLSNTAVKEIPYSPLSSCSPSWNCSSWNICTESTQTRICTDLNACNSMLGKPDESQNCTFTCQPIWNCTGWQPIECPSSKDQTKTCVDLANCASDSGKPALSRTCEPAKSSNLPLVLMIAALVVIAVIITFVIMKVIKKSKAEENNKKDVFVTEKPKEDFMVNQKQDTSKDGE